MTVCLFVINKRQNGWTDLSYKPLNVINMKHRFQLYNVIRNHRKCFTLISRRYIYKYINISRSIYVIYLSINLTSSCSNYSSSCTSLPSFYNCKFYWNIIEIHGFLVSSILNTFPRDTLQHFILLKERMGRGRGGCGNMRGRIKENGRNIKGGVKEYGRGI